MSQSHPSQQQQTSAAPPSVYAVALFPGWQLLDVAGPLDVLNLLQQDHPDFKLYILSHTLDPVPTQTSAESSTFSQSVVPTHTYDSCPDDVQVLLIPGGMGARQAELIGPVKEFVQRTYPSLQFLLTVCTGSAIVAQAGILDGRRATSNKRSFAFAKSSGPKVDWVPEARWVVDGNIWTSSGISAGIDLAYAFVAHTYGEQVAQSIADRSEYTRNTDAGSDPFAKVWKSAEA